MAELNLKKALAQLHAIRDELPKGSIEEKYVVLYHASLADIQKEIGHDLSYFFIPSEELKRHVTSRPGPRIGRYGGGEPTYSKVRYCDRPRFLIALQGAINFIDSLL
jgi:hypothetical protein